MNATSDKEKEIICQHLIDAKVPICLDSLTLDDQLKENAHTITAKAVSVS